MLNARDHRLGSPMRRILILAAALALATPALATPQHLCGWIENPTPANWWLTDKSGEWIIGVQGGHQAEGDLPDFDIGKQYWVKTQPNGHGYGCACIDAEVDAATREVATVVKTKVMRLGVCRRDRALKEPKE